MFCRAPVHILEDVFYFNRIPKTGSENFVYILRALSQVSFFNKSFFFVQNWLPFQYLWILFINLFTTYLIFKCEFYFLGQSFYTLSFWKARPKAFNREWAKNSCESSSKQAIQTSKLWQTCSFYWFFYF